jgi:uncharacterized membrane protein YkoI
VKRRPGILLCVLLAAAPALARDHQEAMQLRRSGEIMPLEDVLRRAPGQEHRRVLEVELERKRGRYIYEVETLDRQGRVWEHEYDAATGEVLRSRREQ